MKPTKQTFIPRIVIECAAMTRLTPEERKTYLALTRRVFTEAHIKAVDGVVTSATTQSTVDTNKESV